MLAACAFGAVRWPKIWKFSHPQIAQAFAQVLTEAAEKIEKPQVKVEGDNEKACGVHKEQTGMILVPQKDMSPENEAVNKDPAGLRWPTCSSRPATRW